MRSSSSPGLRIPAIWSVSAGSPTRSAPCCKRRLDEPSLWDGYLALLGAHGFDVDDAEERFAALVTIANDREKYGALWDLAEALIAHDQAWSLWRARHVLMAERQIGTKTGTGGSSGGAYLRCRVETDSTRSCGSSVRF